MTPRALTAGPIRHLPGSPPPERRERGPITDLVRADRCGCVGYDGLCDGEPVGVVEIRPGHWTARNASGSLVREGALVEVLGVQTGGKWQDPDGKPWTVRSRYTVGLELASVHEHHGASLCAYADAQELLRNGWRPVAT